MTSVGCATLCCAAIEGGRRVRPLTAKVYLSRNADAPRAAAGAGALSDAGRGKAAKRGLSRRRRRQRSGCCSASRGHRGGINRDYRDLDRIAAIRQEQKDTVHVEPPDIVRFVTPCGRSTISPGCEQPTVSILVPVYNDVAYTAECVASIIVPIPAWHMRWSSPTTDHRPDVARLGTIENVQFIAQPTNLGFLKNCTWHPRPAGAAMRCCSTTTPSFCRARWMRWWRHWSNPDVAAVARSSSIPTAGSRRPDAPSIGRPNHDGGPVRRSG